MQAPAFWDRPTPSVAARLLQPAGLAYGAIAAARMRRDGERAAVPVVCVGNFTLGGAGKTPTALRMAALLQDAGETPVCLTRGYGGRSRGPVRVDTARHSAAEVGDEPLLLARTAPTVVARERPAGARLAVADGATVLVMDDGLQNPSLVKDFAIAVVDGETGAGNGLAFPAGPLRAPLSAQWPHVHAVVVLGSGIAGAAVADEGARRGLPVFEARLEPDAAVAAQLKGASVLAFSGIGRPEKFFRTLEACGAAVTVRRSFPDHHGFSGQELEALAREAEAACLVLATTEKDAARVHNDPALRAYAPRLLPVPVTLRLDDGAGFRKLLRDALSRARSSLPRLRTNV